MPLWIYIVAPVGIASIVFTVYWLFGADTAHLKDEADVRQHLQTKLTDASGFSKLLSNPEHTMTWALNLKTRCLAIVYAHGIHINVEPITASHYRSCRVTKTNKDRVALEIHTDSFDRPVYRLLLPASQENVAQDWQQQIHQLLAQEVHA